MPVDVGHDLLPRSIIDSLPNWRQQPIAENLRQKLDEEGHEVPGTDFYEIPVGAPAHQSVALFIGEMLDALPLHNEVGTVTLLNANAEEVVHGLSYVMHGRKTWEDIQQLLQGDMEVFKNEVHAPHNLPSAIGYSLDLSRSPMDPKQNGFSLSRYHISNQNGYIVGQHDGELRATPAGTVFNARTDDMVNLRRD